MIEIVKIENEKVMNLTETYILIYRFRFVTFEKGNGRFDCELVESWFNGVNENVKATNLMKAQTITLRLVRGIF